MTELNSKRFAFYHTNSSKELPRDNAHKHPTPAFTSLNSTTSTGSRLFSAKLLSGYHRGEKSASSKNLKVIQGDGDRDAKHNKRDKPVYQSLVGKSSSSFARPPRESSGNHSQIPRGSTANFKHKLSFQSSHDEFKRSRNPQSTVSPQFCNSHDHAR